MINENLIILKSAYGKTPGQIFHITPCKRPDGLWPDCVRPVDSMGNLILSEADRLKASDPVNPAVFIPMHKLIKVKDGTSFDLTNPVQKATWEAIKHSPLITENRDDRDGNKNLAIDGERTHVNVKRSAQGASVTEFAGRHGRADLYIYHPEKEAVNQQSRRHLIHEAQKYVIEDSLDGKVRMCKLLEKNMTNSHPADVEAYLWDQATQFPEKIIDLYRGKTTHIRLLIITAVEKGIIRKKDGVFLYSDSMVLGAKMDTVVEYLMRPDNAAILNLIKRETFPEMEMQPKEAEKTTAKTTAKK